MYFLLCLLVQPYVQQSFMSLITLSDVILQLFLYNLPVKLHISFS